MMNGGRDAWAEIIKGVGVRENKGNSTATTRQRDGNDSGYCAAIEPNKQGVL